MNTPLETQNSLHNQRIGDIVSDNYHAAGVFRNYGIDFCCGGGRPLGEVCENKGIDLAEITEQLNNIPWGNQSSGDNYTDWSPSFLIDYIVNTHHNFVRNKTVEISAYAAKVAKVHGENHPENVDIFRKFSLLTNELMDHLNAEEVTVFPLIKSLSQKVESGEDLSDVEIDELKKQLGLMIEDHDGAGQLMAEIRELSNNFNPPEDACRTYQILYHNLAGFEEDLHKHVHLENNILFRKAEQLI